MWRWRTKVDGTCRRSQAGGGGGGGVGVGAGVGVGGVVWWGGRI